MPSPFFSGRIPQELFDHVEAHRKSTGESKTDILVKALETYTGFRLNSESKATPFNSTLSQIIERLEKLEAYVFQQKAEPEMSEVERRQYNLLDQIKEVKPVVEKEKEETPEIPKGETKILTTDEVIDKGIVGSQSTLSNWKRESKLPKTYNGFLINESTKEEKAEKNSGKKGKAQDCWRITSV